MYKETIAVVDLPKRNGKKIAVRREYETPEDAIESDAVEFHSYARGVAMGHVKALEQEDLLDKSDKSDPHNSTRVWLFTGVNL